MKNIAAATLLSIALISCKKDTKTITKTDEKTGKTITVEVPADSVKIAETVAVTPAINDSLGVFTQKFKLETGKTYPLTTVQRDVQSMTAPNGQSQQGTNETTDQMSFTVNSFENGIYDITINLIGKKITQKAGGKTVTVDTNSAAPKDEQLKMIYAVNKALSGNTLKMKMDEAGNVMSVTGFEPVYTKITNAVASVIKDAKQRQAFISQFKQTFNEKTMKEQFGKNLVLLPKKGAKIGEKWTESKNFTPDGKLKLSTTYALKNVDANVAEISVTGGVPFKSQKQSQNGVTHNASVEMSQNGTIKIDRNTGWVKNQTINVKATQKESYSDGKQTQSVTNTTTTTLSVNP